MKLKDFLSLINMKCSSCGSDNIIKKSTRNLPNKITKQYYCKDCGKYSNINISKKDLKDGNFEPYIIEDSEVVIENNNDLIINELKDSLTNNNSGTVETIPTDDELITENVRLAKSRQKLQDSNRIERKSFREHARIENSVGEYAKELVNQNKKFGEELSKFNFPEIKTNNDELIGLISMSDIHANELIDIPGNKYDFNVMSARLKKYADECIKLFTAQDIKTILLANLGDILNNDSLLDKLLNQAVNRAKASILVSHILTQFIMHLRQYFNITIISVMGNESRMTEKWWSSNEVVSDNYDHSIFANLKQKFEFANISGITFGEIDKMETVVNINGHNVLFTHDVGKVSSSQKGVQSKIGAYHLKGIDVDFMVSGHIHATHITDISARGSSLAGSNSYNEHNLSLTGRAAQNCFIFGKNYRNIIVVDLQNVDLNNCYSVIKELESYNAKSVNKTIDKTVVFKVII